MIRLVGVDPGLHETGICRLAGNQVETLTLRLPEEREREMARLIVDAVNDMEPAAVAIEDFVYRSPKVDNYRLIKHAVAMGKLCGRLDVLTEAITVPVLWVPSVEAQRDQPKGALAKRLGVPGRNDHERCAYNVACWLRGSMKFARQ